MFLSEATLLENIRKRYYSNKIYVSMPVVWIVKTFELAKSKLSNFLADDGTEYTSYNKVKLK